MTHSPARTTTAQLWLGYPKVINLVDLTILIAVLIGIGNGYRRGVWLSLAQYVGLVLGVVGAAALAPQLTDVLGITDQAGRALTAALILVVGGSLGSSFGYLLGETIRHRTVGPHRNEGEAALGAFFSGLAVIAVAWFLGLSLDRVPNPTISSQIQHSAILRRLDTFFPRPPAFLAGVERTIAGVPFPATFAGLEPNLPAPLQPPASVDTPGVRAAEAVTYKVEGRGCGGIVSGSAYPLGSGYFITNAHVVSGTSGTRLMQASLRGAASASTVWFDPNVDVAILYAPSLTAGALADGDGDRGTQSAVIGYPGGGAETTQPAVVDGAITARGRDIYGQNLVDRQIYVIESLVQPGNSGGPLVDLRGRVLGLVFAASSSNPGQAYALTNAEIAPDIQRGVGRTAGIDTRQYACAV